MVVEQISVGLLERIINRALTESDLLITHGDNKSFFRLPKSLGSKEFRFSIPAFSKRILIFEVEQYPNNIRSKMITISLVNADATVPNGGLRLEIRFEENGNEIDGTFKGNLRNLVLTTGLGLAMHDGLVCYNAVDVTIDFDLEVVGLPDSLSGAVDGMTDKFRSQIAGDLKAMLQRAEIKSKISEAVTRQIGDLLPLYATLDSVSIENGALLIKYVR